MYCYDLKNLFFIFREKRELELVASRARACVSLERRRIFTWSSLVIILTLLNDPYIIFKRFFTYLFCYFGTLKACVLNIIFLCYIIWCYVTLSRWLCVQNDSKRTQIISLTHTGMYLLTKIISVCLFYLFILFNYLFPPVLCLSDYV